jgi:hypothetical protein
MTVLSVEELDFQHDRGLRLGGALPHDASDRPDEPLRSYGEPAGRPFCVFV